MPGRDTILVVEDDTLVAGIIEAALDETYEIVSVETAADAMSTLCRGGIDLMLLDCTLPGGIHPGLIPTADKIGAPVVFMSGDPSRTAGLSDRPRPFVRKPFTLQELTATLEKLLPPAEDVKES